VVAKVHGGIGTSLSDADLMYSDFATSDEPGGTVSP
jgi:hypothetical protein